MVNLIWAASITTAAFRMARFVIPGKVSGTPSDKREMRFLRTLLGIGVLLSFCAGLVRRLFRRLFRRLLCGFLVCSVLTCGFFDLSRALVDFAHGASLLVNGSPK